MKINNINYFYIFIILLIIIPPVLSDTDTFNCNMGDTYVVKWLPNNTYGSANQVGIRDGNSDASRIYIRCDISNVSKNDTLLDAKLYLYEYSAGTTTTAYVYEQTNNSWVESQLKWSNQPCPGDGCSNVSDGSNNTLNSIGWKSWSILDILNNGLTSNSSNISMMIKTNESAGLSISYFYTHEYSISTVRPYFTVTRSNITVNTTTTIINYINNGEFNNITGTTPDNWVFYTNGVGTFKNITPGYNSNNAANVSISTAGTNVQLYQFGINLTPSTSYRLSFYAYSNTGHNLKVQFVQHVSPYTQYMGYVTFDILTNWSQHYVDFTPLNSVPVSDARLQFWFADHDANNDKYYIDDVRLIKIYTPPVPTITYWNVLSTYYNIVWQGGYNSSDNTTDSWNVRLLKDDVGSWNNATNKSINYVTGTISPGTKLNLTVCGYNNTGITGECLQNNTISASEIQNYEYIPPPIKNVSNLRINDTHWRIMWD